MPGRGILNTLDLVTLGARSRYAATVITITNQRIHEHFVIIRIYIGSILPGARGPFGFIGIEAIHGGPVGHRISFREEKVYLSTILSL